MSKSKDLGIFANIIKLVEERMNGSHWTKAGSYPCEQSAILIADSMQSRNPNDKFRVKSPNGCVVYSL